ncbi:HAF repeat-containing protein [Methylococcaceae bacterium WWC4]|nr:HAF repeat-containing protein [Methylococcaceae bacterium WWC4]
MKALLKLSNKMLLVCLFSVCPAYAQVRYTVTQLPSFENGTYPRDINASGQVVVASYHLGIQDYVTGQNGGAPISYYASTLNNSGGLYGVNDKGSVVGWISDLSGEDTYQNFAIYTVPNSKEVIEINTNGMDAYGVAINNAGRVAGVMGGHAFVTDPGGANAVDLGTLGGVSSVARGINESGQVVGSSSVANGQTHAFVASADGTGMIDLGTFGGDASDAKAINAKGQVVGYSTLLNGSSHAFVFDEQISEMVDLGTLGGAESGANDINIHGQIVGWSKINGSGVRHAFVTQGDAGGMIDLNLLADFASSPLGAGVYFTEAFGINDRGQIIVKDSWYGAELLTPIASVPLPGSIWLFGSVFILLVNSLSDSPRVRHARREAGIQSQGW